MTTPRMATNTPTTKVVGGTVGAAAATLLIWGLEQGLGLPVGESVRLAITTILTFAVGYIIPPARRDSVVVTATPGHAAE